MKYSFLIRTLFDKNFGEAECSHFFSLKMLLFSSYFLWMKNSYLLTAKIIRNVNNSIQEY